MLRISGGEAKGRKLKGPKGLDFRPTTGRVKEFIFSIIGPDIQDAVVLDLFSGSGALGIEALSRGAKQVVFVEQSSQHVRIIEHNLELCKYQERAKILRGDVFNYLSYLGRQQLHFHLILADPPFKMAFRKKIVEFVDKNHVLDEEGVLFVEHQDNDPDAELASLKMLRQRKFGHCMVSIYE